jgi:hypothetical protein
MRFAPRGAPGVVPHGIAVAQSAFAPAPSITTSFGAAEIDNNPKSHDDPHAHGEI